MSKEEPTATAVAMNRSEPALMQRASRELLAVLAERERCAKIAEDMGSMEFCSEVTADKIAAAIRKGE